MKYYKPAFIVCVLIFISLSLLHYFSRRPLWLDEIFIFDNIKNLKFSELLGPLSNSQAFPRIYLIGISKFAAQFGYDLLSLRLFPLLSMLAAFFVWLKIYNIEITDKWEALLASLSIACSYSFSYYASELKQYSMDVFVVGIFCLYLIKQRKLMTRAPSKSFILATLLLPFTLLLSYGGFFVFWIVVFNFLFMPKQGLKVIAVSVAYTLLCLLAIIFIYYFDIRHTLSTPALFSYWKDYFINTDSLYSFIKSFSEGFRKLTAWWFGKGKIFIKFASILIPFFASSLFIRGVKALKTNKFKIWDIDSIGFIIFIELFIFGMMKKYPFTGGRITLFYAPFVFYFIIRGIGYFKVNKVLQIGFIAYYVVFLIWCSLNSILYYLKLY